MNETTAETQVPSSPSGLPSAEDVALRQLQHVGAAYALIFVLLLIFAWRATTATRRLAERVDELERDGDRSSGSSR